MRFWYDTEFIDDGRTIDLISIGIVAEDGSEYYAVNSEMPWDRIKGREWLVRNVVPSLPLDDRNAIERWLKHPTNSYPKPGLDLLSLDVTNVHVKPRQVIANEVAQFLRGPVEPWWPVELWAWYGAYDHVALAQLFGPMIQLPDGLPMWTNDLRQVVHHLGVDPDSLPQQQTGLHNALADARHLRVMHQHVSALLAPQPVERGAHSPPE